MKRVILNDKAYTIMKWLCIIFLPALGKLIGALGGIWEWSLPTQQIEDTIDTIALFLGIVIGISAINYKKTGGV